MRAMNVAYLFPRIATRRVWSQRVRSPFVCLPPRKRHWLSALGIAACGRILPKGTDGSTAFLCACTKQPQDVKAPSSDAKDTHRGARSGG